MRFIYSLLALTICVFAYGQDDIPIIEVGEQSTTHVLFMTDLTYVDISIPDLMLAQVVPASKNLLAVKACREFDFVTTISALEANGTMHTFKVRYNPFPENLIIDTRNGVKGTSSRVNTQKRPLVEQDKEAHPAVQAVAGFRTMDGTDNSSSFKRGDAPTIEEIVRKEQQIFHVGDRNFGLEAYCTNVFVYSDLTYLVITLINNTDIGFSAGGTQFAVENYNRNSRSLVSDKDVWIKSSFGSLSCPPRGRTVIGYTIPKLTLLKNECLRIYLYEENGNRNLVLTLSDKDINYAVSPN